MPTYDLSIHFGNSQGKHQINSESLIVFINSYSEIFEELTNSKIDIEIGLPSEGGWKTTLTIISVAISFAGIDNLSILLRGRDSSDLFLATHNLIKDFITQTADSIPDEFPRKCVEQKNKVYSQFQRDSYIDSFDLGDKEIPKHEFHLYIKKLPDDAVEYLGETDITVSSPDWMGKRSWRGQIAILGDTEHAFDLDKDFTGEFWEKVRLDQLPLHTQDVMRVQLFKRPTARVKYLVVRVLRYNDTVIDTPLSDQDIAKMANVPAVKNQPKVSFGQMALFPTSIQNGI